MALANLSPEDRVLTFPPPPLAASGKIMLADGKDAITAKMAAVLTEAGYEVHLHNEQFDLASELHIAQGEGKPFNLLILHGNAARGNLPRALMPYLEIFMKKGLKVFGLYEVEEAFQDLGLIRLRAADYFNPDKQPPQMDFQKTEFLKSVALALAGGYNR